MSSFADVAPALPFESNPFSPDMTVCACSVMNYLGKIFFKKMANLVPLIRIKIYTIAYNFYKKSYLNQKKAP